MFTQQDYSALAQIIDTTWGQSSTEATPTMSVKMSIVNEDTAIIKYTTVVTYTGTFSPMQMHAEFETAQKAVDAYLKEVKKGFKTLTSRSVKLKLLSLEPTMDMLDINSFSPYRMARTAYYRCTGEVEVG